MLLLTGGFDPDWNKVFLELEGTFALCFVGGFPGVWPLGGACPRFERLSMTKSMHNKQKSFIKITTNTKKHNNKIIQLIFL